jgi:hypothetical protein
MDKLDKKKNIGELLIEYGKITRDDLEEGLRLQKELNLRIDEILIKLGKVTKNDIEWVLSKQPDIPFVIVENINLDPKLIGKFSDTFHDADGKSRRHAASGPGDYGTLDAEDCVP